MLTIKAFKLYCIKAETKKANEIHEYFIKLEELLQQIIQEESDELKKQLEQVKEEFVIMEDTNKKKINTIVSKEKEQFLLREFGTIGSIIYIVKVKTYENGKYVIKIGESRKGILMRYNEHKSNYDEILLLDCFMVKKSKEFENFLHNHALVKFNKVTNLKDHENERELFLIGHDLSYKTLLHIINTNIKIYDEFNEYELNKLKMENEILQKLLYPLNNQSIYDSNIDIQNLLNGQNQMLKYIQNLETSNM